MASCVSIQYPVSVFLDTHTTYRTLTINQDCTKHLSPVISFNPRGSSMRCRNCTSQRLAHSLPCLYNWQIVESGLKRESLWFQCSNPYNLCVCPVRASSLKTWILFYTSLPPQLQPLGLVYDRLLLWMNGKGRTKIVIGRPVSTLVLVPNESFNLSRAPHHLGK